MFPILDYPELKLVPSVFSGMKWNQFSLGAHTGEYY